jgi:hypothetical protein
MKRITAGVFFIFVTVCLQAQTLTWDIKFLQGRARESVPIARTIRMETGDNFLISIKPDSDCYCYVICYDSSREIFVLQNDFLKGGIEIYLTEIDITDPPGTETLYVIMSLAKQERLESLIKAYNGNPNSAQNGDNLRQEIARLQDAVSALGQPASSFIPGGGTSRGSTQEYVTRFTEKNIYVSPIIIRH